jgi:polysaccharide export outer membrane protein
VTAREGIQVLLHKVLNEEMLMNSKRLLTFSVVLLGLSAGAYAQTGQATNSSSQSQAAVPIFGVTADSATMSSGAGQAGAVPIYGVTTQAIQPTSAAQPSPATPVVSSLNMTPVQSSSSQSSAQPAPGAVAGGVTVPGTTPQTGTAAQPAPAAQPATPAQPATSTGPDSPQGAMSQMSSDKAQSTMTDATPQSTSANSTTAGLAPQLSERHPMYRVNVGDSLNIKFEFLPNYSEATISVQPDGYISLEGGVPPIYVLGDNVVQIEEKIRQVYKGIMRDPIVLTVELNSFLPPYFICWGEVTKPGKYEMKGDITLTQAIGIAGGYNQMAKHSKVVLFRKVGDQWVSSQVVDLKHMLYTHNLAEDMHLQAGDMIWVPQNIISKMINLEKVIPINTFRLDYVPPTN